MGSEDNLEKRSTFVDSARKTFKWYKNLFFYTFWMWLFSTAMWSTSWRRHRSWHTPISGRTWHASCWRNSTPPGCLHLESVPVWTTPSISLPAASRHWWHRHQARWSHKALLQGLPKNNKASTGTEGYQVHVCPLWGSFVRHSLLWGKPLPEAFLSLEKTEMLIWQITW